MKMMLQVFHKTKASSIISLFYMVCSQHMCSISHVGVVPTANLFGSNIFLIISTRPFANIKIANIYFEIKLIEVTVHLWYM